jgi:nucleoid DNA-binding protein
MHFKEFNREVSEKFGLSLKQSKDILAFVENSMLEKIKFGTHITFRELGTILIKVRQKKKYLNFQKDVMVTSPKKYYIYFRVPKKLKKFLSEKVCY